MYGLTMIKDYLDEILSGFKTYDARSYPPAHTGKIALMDSSSMKIYGTAVLSGCREISREEYCSWHATGKWEGMKFEADINGRFYAWELSSVEALTCPVKINAEKHVWVRLPDDIRLDCQDTFF